MIPPKRFDIVPPDWGKLRKSRCVQILLSKSNMVDGNKTTAHIIFNNWGISSTNFVVVPEILEIVNRQRCGWVRSLPPARRDLFQTAVIYSNTDKIQVLRTGLDLNPMEGI